MPSSDTTRPTLAASNGIALGKTTLNANDSTSISFNFTEAVTGLDNADVNLPAGCSLTGLKAVNADGSAVSGANPSSARWSATLHTDASAQSASNAAISVNLTGVYNSAGTAGEGNSAATGITIVDNVGPTATIAVNDDDGSTSAAGVQTLGVTITFSEALTTGLTMDMLRADNGTLSNLQALDGSGNPISGDNPASTRWRATLTLDPGVDASTNYLHLNTTSLSDAAGNGFADIDVRSDAYQVDTRAPVLVAARVNGNQLVLTYSEGGSALETAAGHTPANSAFTVKVNGTANAVTAVAVNGDAHTVTLTLTTAVTAGQTVTVSYTDPSADNDSAALQDGPGNDAASFSDRAVTNHTGSPAPAAVDTSAPAIEGDVVVTNTSLRKDQTTTVTFTLSEAVKGLTADNVTAENCTLSGLTKNDSGTTWSATLTPNAGVEQAYNLLRVNLAGITDNADNAGSGSRLSNAYSVDTKAPVLATASANGNQLVLTYTEGNSLDSGHTAPESAFTVLVNGTANAVTAVAVNPTAKTVTLTLTRAVSLGQTVTVAYTDPTPGDDARAVQDSAGNDAASFGARAVDVVAPVLNTATVNGSQLVLRFDSTNNLDATHIPAPTDFIVRADSARVDVSLVTVDAEAKTVTLTLASPVTQGQSVTVRYTDPSVGNDENAIQDNLGNDAADIPAAPATAPAPGTAAPDQPVTNNTPAAPAPAPAPAPAQDADKDGVSDALENQAPAPGGAATGDGNGDGVQDSAQATVASASFARGAQGASHPDGLAKTWVTLVMGSTNGKPAADQGKAQITALEQQDAATGLPAKMEQPIGLTQFQASLDSTGTAKSFSLYVDANLAVNGYWVKDSAGTWTNLASEAQGGKMVTEGGRLRLDFSITDGSQYDADGQADGSISAHGAAAQMPLSLTGQAPDTGKDGVFWF